MYIQVQLSKSYQGDLYLRDRLQEAIYIPHIPDFFKDRPERSTQDLINRVGNKLSHRSKPSGDVFVNWALRDESDSENMALYGLGHKYGGSALRPTKSFIKNKAKRGGINGRGAMNGRPRSYSRPRWIRGVKVCFVCKTDHRANEHHSREEFTAEINKLKSKLPTAFLTELDEEYIYGILAGDFGQETDGGLQDNAEYSTS